EGPQPIARAVAWMLEALEAIAEAHARGFVHRDVKPANLFLAHRIGGGSLIKVLDFGLVKNVDNESSSSSSSSAVARGKLTRTGTAMGTPAYMSPEQIRCSPGLDARADVWALGTTLYELLTAEMPFEAPSVSALIVSVVRDEPIPIRTRRPEVSEALASV